MGAVRTDIVMTSSDKGATGGQITRLTVRASPDSASSSVIAEAQQHARAGDAAWRDWLVRVSRGEAAIVQLVTSAEIDICGVRDRIEVTNHGVWIERDAHPPKIEEQIREVAYKGVRPLHYALLGRGVDVAVREMEEMFFHVELDPALVRSTGA